MLPNIYAALSAVASGAENTLHRYILTQEDSNDSLTYAFTWQVLSALVFLPFFLVQYKSPSDPFAYILVGLASLCYALFTYLIFETHANLELSISTPIRRLVLVFTLILSIFVLKETLTAQKIAGTLLIFLGLVFLTSGGANFSLSNKKGIVLAILTALIASFSFMIDKLALNFFTPATFSFLVYFIPAMILFPFVKNKRVSVIALVKNKPLPLFGTVILGCSSYYFLLTAFLSIDTSTVIPIYELNGLVAVLGGIIFLKERQKMKEKLLAALVVLVGALLILL
ncbi:DMT family transporter [Candidatus Micrarchaeota archaeon]|nr:DMT family transporter [Candidatus Micrarchaeota archaeon]